MHGASTEFTEQDIHWMRHAISLAQQAALTHEVPVGAVLVKGNVLLGEGHNQPIGQCDPTAHAEIQAIRQACENEKNYRLPGTTLYVTIEPCAMCAGAIVHARIERVVFGATEPKAGALISSQRFFDMPHLNHNVKMAGGCLAQECSHEVSQFFSWRREQKRRLKQSKPTDD